MIVTDHDQIADLCRLYRNHGLIDRDTWQVPGFNSRLSSVQALVGLDSLGRIEWVNERRRQTARCYDDAFRNIEEITLPPGRDYGMENFHLYVILAQRRDELLQYLMASNIEAKIHYPVPLHRQRAIKELGRLGAQGSYPVADFQAQHIITLPCHEYLSDEELAHVIGAVRSFYHY